MLYRLLVSLTRSQKGAILIAMDGLLFAAVALGVWIMEFEFWTADVFANLTYVLGLMLPAVVVFLAAFGIHRIPLNAYEARMILLTALSSLGAVVFGFFAARASEISIGFDAFALVAMSFTLVSAASRVLLKAFVISLYRAHSGATRVLIYGAGRTGQQLAAALATDRNVQPVGFIDDNTALHGVVISGLKVNPTIQLHSFVEENQIDRLVLAMPSLSESERTDLAGRLSTLDCEIHAIPTFAAMLTKKIDAAATEPLDFSSLLGRSQLESSIPGVSEMYRDKAILVTGAGGSIGSEICKQIAQYRPRRLVLLDHSEIALYDIARDLQAQFPQLEISPVLGSVCHEELVSHQFRTHDIQVVLHAAAYKQLPMLEENSLEGMRNNVLGTRIVALCAQRHGSERFILISTDKAVRPTSWLGYSKRTAEMVVQDLAMRSQTTKMSMVRFGNVLGSAGSVVPLFREQIDRGGPVTVTHPNVTRYFMTVSEAVRLVLLAGTFAKGGDVFVLDMGQPVKILDLAKTLIKASGHTLRMAADSNEGISIKFSGLREGEKLCEELLIGHDLLPTPHAKILRAQEEHPSALQTAALVRDISRAIEAYDVEQMKDLPDRWAQLFGSNPFDLTDVPPAAEEA